MNSELNSAHSEIPEIINMLELHARQHFRSPLNFIKSTIEQYFKKKNWKNIFSIRDDERCILITMKSVSFTAQLNPIIMGRVLDQKK